MKRILGLGFLGLFLMGLGLAAFAGNIFAGMGDQPFAPKLLVLSAVFFALGFYTWLNLATTKKALAATLSVVIGLGLYFAYQHHIESSTPQVLASFFKTGTRCTSPLSGDVIIQIGENNCYLSSFKKNVQEVPATEKHAQFVQAAELLKSHSRYDSTSMTLLVAIAVMNRMKDKNSADEAAKNWVALDLMDDTLSLAEIYTPVGPHASEAEKEIEQKAIHGILGKMRPMYEKTAAQSTFRIPASIEPGSFHERLLQVQQKLNGLEQKWGPAQAAEAMNSTSTGDEGKALEPLSPSQE